MYGSSEILQPTQLTHDKAIIYSRRLDSNFVGQVVDARQRGCDSAVNWKTVVHDAYIVCGGC